MSETYRSSHRRKATTVTWMMAALAVAAMCSPFTVVRAQELYLLAGAQRTPELDDDSYSFSLTYAHNLTEWAYATFGILNEGHVPDHHRDGNSSQIWLRKLSASRKLGISAGVGPYRYFDTTGHPDPSRHINDHGWGVMYSVAANWYLDAPWIVQLRYNRVETSSSIDTDTLLIGIGYRMDRAERPGPVVPASTYGYASAARNQVSLLLGSTIVNNFQSPHGLAFAAEYRHNLTPFIDVAVTAVDEGEAGEVNRRGLAAQFWLGRRFLGDRATVGAGIGPYVARDEGPRESATRVLGLLGLTATYQLAPDWSVRATWYRTETTSSHDTDVIVAGISRHF